MIRFRSVALYQVFLSLSALALFSYSAFLGEKALAQPPIALASSTSPENGDYEARSTPIYDFTMDDIDGKPRTLAEFKGKVMMIVNTAGFCGNTPQYEDLPTLFER